MAKLTLFSDATDIKVWIYLFIIFIKISQVWSIVTFPDDGGVYSLFPHEDLKTGRRLRFPQGMESKSGISPASFLRSTTPNSLYTRAPGSSSKIGMNFGRSRIYFDDERLSRFKLYTPRIRITPNPPDELLNAKLNNNHNNNQVLGSTTSTYIEEKFKPSKYPERFLNLNLKNQGQEKGIKLPPRGDYPTRFHIFDPQSKTFQLGSGPSAPYALARVKNPDGHGSKIIKLNMKDAEKAFIDHDKYLEYHTKKALAELKEHEALGEGAEVGNDKEKEKKDDKKDQYEMGNDREAQTQANDVQIDENTTTATATTITTSNSDKKFKSSKKLGAHDEFNPPPNYSKHLGKIPEEFDEITVKGNVQKLVKSTIGIGRVDKISNGNLRLEKDNNKKVLEDGFIPYQPAHFARGFLGSTTTKDENGIEFGTEGNLNLSDEINSSQLQLKQLQMTQELLKIHEQQQQQQNAKASPSNVQYNLEKYGQVLNSKENHSGGTLLRPLYPEVPDEFEDSTETPPEYETKGYSHGLRENQFISRRMGQNEDDDATTEDQNMITLSPNGYFTPHVSETEDDFDQKRTSPRIINKSTSGIKPKKRAKGKSKGKSNGQPPTSLIFLESSESVVTQIKGPKGNDSDIIRVMRVKQSTSSDNSDDTLRKTQSIMSVLEHNMDMQNTRFSLESSSSTVRGKGVVSKVHAHVSNCPKLYESTEIICDIYVSQKRDALKDPSQITVGWRRKYHNETKPDVLLALNKTITAYSKSSDSNNGSGEKPMEDFHDKFNVTLAPGISPMLRSVLLIRTTTPPDCGNYQCEVFDGEVTLTSDTLLFLCH